MPVPRTSQGLARKLSKQQLKKKKDDEEKQQQSDEDDQNASEDDEDENAPSENDATDEFEDEEFFDGEEECEEEGDDEEESDGDDSDDSDDDEEEEDDELGPDPIHITVQLSDSEVCKILHFPNDVSFGDFKTQIANALGLDPTSKFIISRKRKTKPPQQIMIKKHFDYMVDSYFEHEDQFLRIIVTPATGTTTTTTTTTNQLDSTSSFNQTSNNNSNSNPNATLKQATISNSSSSGFAQQQQQTNSSSGDFQPTASANPVLNASRPPTSSSYSNRPISASTRFGGTTMSSTFGGNETVYDTIRSELEECVAQGVSVTWREIRHLGSGAFGKVVEGVIEPKGFVVAIKHMTFPGAQGDAKKNAADATTMVEEIRLMKNLRHPHIVAYYGSQMTPTEDGGRIVDVFMEACHGGSVTSLRRKAYGGRFPVTRVRDYIRQVLDGLDYLHRKRVVHRDIKGENVLISSQGFAKLADFGCSKKLGGASFEATSVIMERENSCGDSVHTQAANDQGMAKTLVGTPLYIAPEVLTESAEGYFESADIWSVGCLVLDLFGKKPWRMANASVYSIMFAIAQSKSLPTGMPDHFVDPLLLDFLTKCFQREPKLRPTASALLDHPWLTCPDNELKEPIWSEDLEAANMGTAVSSSSTSSGNTTVKKG